MREENNINANLITMNEESRKQMFKLYLFFCQPSYIIDKTFEFKYHWINEDAKKKAYENCEELIKYNNSLMEERRMKCN